MNENQEFQLAYRNIILISWFIMIIVSIIILILALVFNRNNIWYSWNISYLLGVMTNIFAFNLLKNNIQNISSEVKSSVSGSISNYAVRLMIYAFVLFISFENAKLNPYIVASGFVTVRISIYIYSFLKRKS